MVPAGNDPAQNRLLQVILSGLSEATVLDRAAQYSRFPDERSGDFADLNRCQLSNPYSQVGTASETNVCNQ